MLDRNVDPKPHPSIMSIGRKWVSDTNLSKLLHETIEKKQANKQSKLPDFCKDAILSATIKKISSALLINQNLSSENDELEILKDQNQCADVYPNLSKDISDEQWEGYSDIAMSLDNVELEDMDSSSALQKASEKSTSRLHTVRPPFERQSACNSPKRKRQPSFEEDGSNFTNLETVAPTASPCKKRRADFLKCKSSQGQSHFIIGDDDEDWSEDDDGENTDTQHNAHGYGAHAQRSQSLPHLTFYSKDNMITPSKNFPGSVVNSISELSIDDCLGPSGHNSWCFSNDKPADSDPLELNGFFQELNTVSVNPNS